MTSKFLLSMIGLLAVAVLPDVGMAIPEMINYQGVLTDADGNTLDGEYEMSFRIYDQEEGGDYLWWEKHPAVEVEDGIFSVQLGSVVPLPLDQPPFMGHSQRWLGLSVGDDPEMTPRRRFTSVPFAYEAEYAGLRYKNTSAGGKVDIPVPHFVPFQIMLAETHASPSNAAWITAAENDMRVAYTGIDGFGNIVRGSCSLGEEHTILEVAPGVVLRTKADWTHTFVLESIGSAQAVVITPHCSRCYDPQQ